MGLIFVLASPFIISILGKKWEDCTIYIQIFAITTCLTPISSLNQAIPLVKGRSDYTFRIELTKKIFSTAGILILIPFGIKTLAIFASTWNIIIYLIDIYFTYKLINLNPIKQIKSSISSILSSIIMVAIVAGIINLINENTTKLFIGCMSGILSYFIINKVIIKNEMLNEIQSYYKNTYHKHTLIK